MGASAESERNAAERLLDLTVYAPLGLALEFRKMFPDLAQRGRRQFTFTKSLGKMAVNKGGGELRKRLGTEAEVAPGTASRGASEPAGDGAGEIVPVAEGPSPEDLAIAEYDSLSAQHVVRRLDGLTPEDLEAVRSYEECKRGRRTILTRITQLQE